MSSDSWIQHIFIQTKIGCVMAYKYGCREQITLLPDSIEDYVAADDPVRAYDAFVDALDLTALGLLIDENQVGNSSYDPVSMLKILVYGYSYGWRSSRKLERALYHNLSFMWLTGGLKPDHKTISTFRKDNKAVLKNVLKQCVQMCMALGLIQGNVLFVDGSKFRANAGKSQSKSSATWEKELRGIDKRIDELLDQCNQIDNQESDSYVKMNKELKSKQVLKERISKFLEGHKDKEELNGTDPESKIMKGRQGSHPGYNGQVSVDDGYGLIASADAINSSSDRQQLEPQTKNAEANLGKPTKTVCADSGYHNVDHLTPLTKDHTIVVPSQFQAAHNPKENPFSKDKFKYIADDDIYVCPAGKELHYSQYDKKRNRLRYIIQNASDCHQCKHFGTCTNAKKGRSIARLANEEVQNNLAHLYVSKQGQKIYKRRKSKVEHPFGHIKRNLNAGQFLLRGLQGVNAELSVLASCFNISRMITILGGVESMMNRIRQIN